MAWEFECLRSGSESFHWACRKSRVQSLKRQIVKVSNAIPAPISRAQSMAPEAKTDLFRTLPAEDLLCKCLGALLDRRTPWSPNTP